MKKYTKRILAFLCALALLITTVLGNSAIRLAQAADDITPVTLDGFTAVTIKDFEKDGYQMPEGLYGDPANENPLSDYALKGGESLNKKLLNMYVEFTSGGGNERIDIAGSGAWTGFSFFASPSSHYLHIYTNYGVAEPAQPFDIDLTPAGLTKAIGVKMLVQLSIEFVDDATDSVIVGVYVNGEACGTYTITGCNLSKFGGYIGLYRQGSNCAITVNSVGVEEPTPAKVDGFDNLTIKDFEKDGTEMATGEYECNNPGDHSAFFAKEATNFHKKLLSMKVKYEGGAHKNSIILSGNTEWCGFNIHPNNNGSQLIVDKTWIGGMTSAATPTLNANVAGLPSFINNEFILQMSFEYGEPDGSNKADLTLGIYINGKLYNNQTFTIEDCDMGKVGKRLELYRETVGQSIYVDNVSLDEAPIMPDATFDQITFGHFGIVDKEYPAIAGDLAIYGTASGRTTLNKTVLSGDVLLEGSNSSIIIWGGTGGWNGLRMYASKDSMGLSWINPSDQQVWSRDALTSSIAGVDFVGEEYNLKLSAELIDAGDDGNVNDIKIGIWFNDVLYNQEYFIATDIGNLLGNHFGVYCASTGDKITFTSDADLLEQPNEDLKKVSFKNYGLESKEYVSGADAHGTYADGTTTAGTVLCGDVKLKGDTEVDLMLGFTTNSWYGVRLTRYGGTSDLRLIYQTESSYAEPLVMDSKYAGVDFNNEEFNLMWSMELVDNDNGGSANDLKIGLWFNGFLYKQTYTYINNYALTVGNNIETYSAAGSSITLNSVATSDEPIMPDETFDKITFGHFGIVDKKYPSISGDHAVQGSASGKSNLDRTVIKGDIFLEGGDSSMIIWGGVGSWNGLRMYPSSNGTMQLTWFDPQDHGTEIATLDSNIAGVDFVGEKYNIMLSAELVANDADNVKDDIKIGIWFNNTLYNQEFFAVPNMGGTNGNFGSYFAVYCPNAADAVTLGSATELLEQPNGDLTKVTFSHYGLESKEYVSGADASGTYADATTSEGTVLYGDVKLKGDTEVDLMLGFTTNSWYGVRLTRYGGTSDLRLIYQTEGSYTEPLVMESKYAGVDFNNEEFNLMWSMELVDNDNGGSANDLKIGLWFNGFLYKQTYTYINNYALTVGNNIATYSAAGSSITLNSDEELVPEPEYEGPTQIEGFANITLNDFVDASGNQLQDGVYSSDVAGQYYIYTLNGKDNFDKTIISLQAKFNHDQTEQWNTKLDFSATRDWTGIATYVTNDGKLQVEDVYGQEPKTVNQIIYEEGLLNKEFLLEMSFEYVDSDSDNAYDAMKVGVYIDGELYGGQTFTYSNLSSATFGNKMGMYFTNADASITLGSVGEGLPTPDPDPIMPSDDLTKITFAHFGIDDDTYYPNGDLAVQGSYNSETGLDGTLLCGNVLLSGSDWFQLILGGNDATAWDGVRLLAGSATSMNLEMYKGHEAQYIETFTSDKAGVNFVGEAYDLMISTEIIDNDGDNQENDIKLGFWFNNKLYDNRYIIISNRAGDFANKFAAYCSAADASITLNSVPELVPEPEPEKVPNENFEKITFAHFGIKDNTYKYNGDIVAQGQYKERDTLDQTVLCGNVLLDGEDYFQLVFGGQQSGWDGLRFITGGPVMSLEWFKGSESTPITSFYSMNAGVDFVGEAFDLMVSTELIDADGDNQKNDIQFGIWFNGKLYDNQYVVVKDMGDQLGNRFAAYCSNENASVTLNSVPELVPEPVPPKKPNASFDWITFEYFGVDDGTYKYDGTANLAVEGKATKSLDKKVLCGDVLFEGKGENTFTVGGQGNAWYGLRFVTLQNNGIALYWHDQDGVVLMEVFDPTAAEATLVGEWLNLMISTEIKDVDGDGEKDDIEVGVWFNGKLYQENYLKVIDKASRLGNLFSLYCTEADNKISIRSIPEYVKGFDYSIYGLTKDWEKTLLGTGFKAEMAVGGSRDAEPFTGDLLAVGSACVFGAAAITALVACIYMVLQRKKES